MIPDFKLNTKSFGFLDLTKKATNGKDINYVGILLAILAGALQYVQTKMMTPATNPNANKTAQSTTDQFASSMNKQMLYLFPALTVWMGLSFPMGLTLYWVVSTLFAIIQQAIILRIHDNEDKKNDDKKVIDIQPINK